MSEAPKRVWVDPEYIEDENDCVSRVKIMHRDVEYIRADLVDGLVEALEALTSLCEVHGDFRNGVTDPMGTIDEGDYIANLIICDARAALKAMEEG